MTIQYGFNGVVAINRSGDYDAPVWHALDVAGDISIDDDSDEIDATTRASNGVKQTVRSLLSRSATIPLESASGVAAGNPLTGGSNLACLLGASRLRQAVCDLAFFDPGATLDAEGDVVTAGTGVRMLSMVKLADNQPMGDRWLYEFEVKPGRVQSGADASYASAAVLDTAYTIA